MSMTADLVVLLDRERTEVERLKEMVTFFQRQCNESFEQGRATAQKQIDQLQFSKEYFENETTRLRREVAKSEIPYPKAASEEAEVTRLRGVVSRLQDRLANKEATESFDVYNAQNELELLRTIRRSQAEGIMKLRQQLTEACTERDSASRRAESWRKAYNDVVIRLRKARKLFVELRDERDVAREGLAQARAKITTLIEQVTFLHDMREKAIHKFNDYCKELEQARRANRGLDQDRQKLYREMDILRNQLAVSQAVNHIVARREANNPRLEMMLEESYRNEFKRNIDNQKATDAPNCQSS